ncbi:MAG: MFS transporter [Actinobacteria bacterium]|nr:MFS transporter [Actinomycetota bacterium]
MDPSVAAPPSPVDIARTRRRLTRTVFLGVGAGTSALYATFTAAPLVAVAATGSRALAGLPGAASILGAALGAAVLSSVMSSRGRAPGLMLGWGLGALGALTGVVAAVVDSFALLLAGMLLIGTGHGANQLSRFVAADMQPPERRGFVLSWVVWAGTIGAALGPIVLRAGGPVGRVLGISTLGGVFVFGAGFYALAVAAAMTMRPDPSLLADKVIGQAGAQSDGGLATVWRSAGVRTTLIAMLFAQVTMILIMTITPVHMGDARHTLGTIGFVMSGHFVGMFALAPLAGKLSDRLGPKRVIIAGLGLVIAAGILAALAPDHSSGMLSVALLVLGLGWCFTFVAGSASLTVGMSYVQRVRLQGNVDVLLWSSSAAASLGSGLLLASLGYSALALIGAALVILPVLFVVRWASPAT